MRQVLWMLVWALVFVVGWNVRGLYTVADHGYTVDERAALDKLFEEASK